MPTDPESSDVWCVWTQSGEYEGFWRDLHGIFATRDLADHHADEIRPEFDEVEVVETPVLTEAPIKVTRYSHTATLCRYQGTWKHRTGTREAWSNEVHAEAISESRYVRVVGIDRDEVNATFDRLFEAATTHEN